MTKPTRCRQGPIFFEQFFGRKGITKFNCYDHILIKYTIKNITWSTVWLHVWKILGKKIVENLNLRTSPSAFFIVEIHLCWHKPILKIIPPWNFICEMWKKIIWLYLFRFCFDARVRVFKYSFFVSSLSFQRFTTNLT